MDRYAWDTNETSLMALRPDGYPGSMPSNKYAHKLTLRNVQLKAMPGRYVVSSRSRLLCCLVGGPCYCT